MQLHPKGCWSNNKYLLMPVVVAVEFSTTRGSQSIQPARAKLFSQSEHQAGNNTNFPNREIQYLWNQFEIFIKYMRVQQSQEDKSSIKHQDNLILRTRRGWPAWGKGEDAPPEDKARMPGLRTWRGWSVWGRGKDFSLRTRRWCSVWGQGEYDQPEYNKKIISGWSAGV